MRFENFMQNVGGSLSWRTGVDADRTSLEFAGLYYGSTDTQEIWYYDGSSWLLVASNGAGSNNLQQVCDHGSTWYDIAPYAKTFIVSTSNGASQVCAIQCNQNYLNLQYSNGVNKYAKVDLAGPLRLVRRTADVLDFGTIIDTQACTVDQALYMPDLAGINALRNEPEHRHDFSTGSLTITESGIYTVENYDANLGGINIPAASLLPSESITIYYRAYDIPDYLPIPYGVNVIFGCSRDEGNTLSQITHLPPEDVHIIKSVWDSNLADYIWICVNKPQQNTQMYDLGVNNILKYPQTAKFSNITGTTGDITMPAPANFTNQRMIVMNLDNAYNVPFNATNQPVTPDGTPITNVQSKHSAEFISDGQQWIRLYTFS